MARARPAPPRLPPPTAADCWLTFWKWVLGIPLLIAGSLGLVWFAFRATGSMGMSWQLESGTATVLFWLAAIGLLYPVMLWVWCVELREGLSRARDWEALTPEARAAALAEATAAALAAGPKRRSRKQKG